MGKAVRDAVDGGLKVDGELLGFLIGEVKAILTVVSSLSGNSHFELGSRVSIYALCNRLESACDALI